LRKYIVFLVILILLLTAPGSLSAFAQQEPAATGTAQSEVTGLTLKQAVDLALVHSESVQKAAKEIDRTWDLREESNKKIDYVPAKTAGDPELEISWSNLLADDLIWRMSSRELTVEQDKVTLAACQKYWEIVSALDKVQAAQDAVTKAQWDLRIGKATFVVGMISQPSLLAIQAQASQADSSLTAAKNELENAYMSFDQLIGSPITERPNLSDTLNYVPLSVDNLDNEVGRIVNTSPSVWLANESVNLQSYYKDMIMYTGEYRPYEVRKIEVEQAELDASSAKKIMKEITYSLYYNVKTLEETQAALQESIKASEENLRVCKLKFDLGMVTNAEVAAAQATLSDLKQKNIQAISQHAYLKLAFKKPWAHVSLSTSG
jgi:outer membrane protein TolC